MDRIPCRTGAVLEDANGKAFDAAVVTDLSEGGAFVQRDTPLRPGTRIQLQFSHPATGEEVHVGARVARRVLKRPGRDDEPGNGVYFEESLTRFEQERRAATRKSCSIRTELHVGRHDVGGSLEDIGEGGAMLRTTESMQIGAVLRLEFRHPAIGKEVETWALVVRGPMPLAGGYRGYGICFDETLTELAELDRWERNEQTGMLSPKLPPDGHDVSVHSDVALAKQLMTSRVVVDDGRGRHRGCLKLAGRNEVLVACEALPGKGQELTLYLQRSKASGLPPIQVAGRVRRGGAAAVDGWKPGFVMRAETFGQDSDREAYKSFVEWLRAREAG